MVNTGSINEVESLNWSLEVEPNTARPSSTMKQAPQTPQNCFSSRRSDRSNNSSKSSQSSYRYNRFVDTMQVPEITSLEVVKDS
jgi:hypothetical protein